jgi:HSP20 family protein
MVNGLARALDMLLDLQHSMDRAQTTNWSGPTTAGRGAFPPVNIFSDDGGVVVVAELPGVDKGDVEIEIRRDQVRIRGRKSIDYGEGASMHRRERQQGSFDRTLNVPFQIDAQRVEASQSNGVLAIRLPQAEADKPRTVVVE